MKRMRQVFSFMFIMLLIISMIPVKPIHAKQVEDNRPTIDVKKTTVEPIIDGAIDESFWTVDELLSVKLGNGNFQDATFGMLWDQKYLYVAIDIEDEALIHDGSGHWFEQDNVSIFLDPTLHQSSPYQNNDMQFGLVYQPNSTTPAFHFGGSPIANHNEANENKILRAIQTTDKGWSAEVAIPWDMLDFDPNLTKELGIEVHVTDRDQKEENDARTSAWSAYQRDSFWNDTFGFGVASLVDDEVTGTVNDILLDENFDDVNNGELPFGWTSHSSSETEFEVEDGKLVFDGSLSGKSGRALAPVQWDNYIVEADLSFEEVLNEARWASLMFRASANGNNQYNQMAVRQNGTYEIAYLPRSGGWSVPVSGEWENSLVLNEPYTLKVRVVGNNVQEYIKPKNEEEFTLLVDETLDLLERGKVGVQADQSKVTFDNMKVTRVRATDLTMDLEEQLEALTGPIDINYTVQFSDGVEEEVPAKEVKLYSNDESVIKVMDNKLYPIEEGKATVKAIYENVEIEKEVTVNESESGAGIIDLQHDEGYMFASVGDNISLDEIKFSASFNDLTEGEITGNELTWKANSDQVNISETKIAPKQKGVYELTAEKNDVSTTFYLFVKEADESEYVLFEENFDNIEDGQLPEGWEDQKTGTVNVQDGALFIDGTGDDYGATSVLLPEYLGLFGNYKIEADFTHVVANDSGRWHSIMYRIQNDSYPYYQMAVRKNAMGANGVEFAERTPENGWNVPEKAPFTESISEDKMYRYTVITHENRVQQYIDDMLLIDTDLATNYEKGRIGLQAAGSKTKIDNIRVTLQTEQLPYIPKPGDNFAKVIEPDTKIALAPSVVTEVKNSEQLDQLTVGALPATAIFHIDSNLDITDSTGSRIADLEQVLRQIDQKIIPAFSVKDEATVDSVIDYLQSNHIEDAFVLSSNPSLVKKAREMYPIIRGIIDYSGQSAGNLMDIRKTTNSHLSKIAILSQEDATRENVAYLQARLITVWVKEDENTENKTVNIHKVITTGPNGVIVNDTNEAIEALGVYSNNITLIRKPLIVGHRGIPGLAPENTVEGSILAFEKGSNAIENDLYLTKDGHVVVMHDWTIDRTTTGSGAVEDFTLEELKQFKANKQFPEDYPDVKIPTLTEYFDAFKGEDVQLFLEIKSSKPEIIDKMIELIEQYNIEDQVTVISFNSEQMKLLSQKMPGMSGGFLLGRGANIDHMHRELRQTLFTIQHLNTTFNPSYGGTSSGLDKLMEVAKHRGVTIWPWTYRNYDIFVEHFLYGTYGLTTDYAHWASDWAAAIHPEEETYELTTDEAIELNATIDTYIRDTKEITPDIVVIDGKEHIQVDGNKITAKSAGTAHVLLRHTHDSREADRYDIYTEPIEITVEQGKIDVTALEERIEEAKTYTNEDGKYTNTSFNALQEAIKIAEEAVTTIETEEELEEAIEALQSAIDGLEERVDVTALEELIEEAKTYTNEDGKYTNTSFNALQEAIKTAEETVTTIETEEELEEAIEALQSAIDGLEERVDVTALEELIEEVKTYTNEDETYTETSFEALQLAIEAAEVAVTVIETEEELEEALAALQLAIDELEFIINEEKLAQLLEEAIIYTDEPVQYTDRSFQALLTAIEQAANVLEEYETEEELVEAYMALFAAIEGLTDKITEADLVQLIEEAETYSNDNLEYTEASFDALQETIEQAANILETYETEEELVEAYEAILLAIDNLEARVDVTALEELIETAKTYNNDDETYTKSSFQALEEAVKVAEESLTTIETAEDLEASLKALETAIDNLVEKVDVTELEQLIEEAKTYTKDQEKYTKASFKSLKEAIKEAEKALTTIESTADLEASLNALETAIDNLEEKEDDQATPGKKDDKKDKKQDKNQGNEQVDKNKQDKKVHKDKKDNNGPKENQPKNKDNQTNKVDQSKKTDAKGKQLPNTATKYFNYILIGSILIILAFAGWQVGKRSRKAE